MFMNILNKQDPEYDYLLERCKFGYWFSTIAQKQHALMQMYIRTKTENIHIISRYTEESNIRLRLFEAILKCTSDSIKSELLDSLFVQNIVSTLLACDTKFDVAFGKSNYKFLPFREFQPFRNEAIVLISIIFANRDHCQTVQDETISELIKANSLFTEIENLKQKKNPLSRMSAFAFFSTITHQNLKNSQ